MTSKNSHLEGKYLTVKMVAYNTMVGLLNHLLLFKARVYSLMVMSLFIVTARLMLIRLKSPLILKPCINYNMCSVSLSVFITILK